MSKSTRSVSLPDRAVNQLVNNLDRIREVKTVLKNDGKRSLEKENEIEVNIAEFLSELDKEMK